MKNIVLIGMPGVGKSCIGVVLAKALGMLFVDSDIVIQEKTGKTLSTLISELGIEGFLALEDKINSEICAENTVIATGGSAVFGENAMKHFKETGTVVYLSIDCDVLSSRLGDLDSRGVVRKKGQELKDIYSERCALYERYADITVHETGAVFRIDETIETIKHELKM